MSSSAMSWHIYIFLIDTSLFNTNNLRASVCVVISTHFGDMRIELDRSVDGFYCVHLCCAQPSPGCGLWREPARARRRSWFYIMRLLWSIPLMNRYSNKQEPTFYEVLKTKFKQLQHLLYMPHPEQSGRKLTCHSNSAQTLGCLTLSTSSLFSHWYWAPPWSHFQPYLKLNSSTGISDPWRTVCDEKQYSLVRYRPGFEQGCCVAYCCRFR